MTVGALPLPLDWRTIWRAMPAIRRGVLRYAAVLGIALAAVQAVPVGDADCSIKDVHMTTDLGVVATDDVGRPNSIGRKAECDLPLKGDLKLSVPLWEERF